MLVETDLFEGIELLKGLPIEQQDFLGRYAQHKTYGKMAIICSPGESTDWVYFVVGGVVRNMAVSEDGREVVKNLLYPGEMFGELGLSGITVHTDFAGTFKAGAEVLRIPLDAIKELIVRNPEVGQRLIAKLGERIARADNLIEDLVFFDARTRIIGFMKDQATNMGVPFGDEILVEHGFTHQDMANITGTSRQLVTIVLNQLKRKKLISFDRTSILIRDISKLE